MLLVPLVRLSSAQFGYSRVFLSAPNAAACSGNKTRANLIGTLNELLKTSAERVKTNVNAETDRNELLTDRYVRGLTCSADSTAPLLESFMVRYTSATHLNIQHSLIVPSCLHNRDA